MHIPSLLKHSNIYEVNLRQYSAEGSIKAFAAHLPRLHQMGVQIIWMMPMYPIGTINRKGTLGSYYSIKDFCDVNPEFGTKSDFRELVEEVHGYGMKIIIDWVANHAAWDNVWAASNPEFFVQDADGNFKSPYDWDDVIQIDHHAQAEQQAMLAAMQFWISEFDIDGFRADLAHLTPLPFWINARTSLNKIKKDLIWLAETEDVNYFKAFDIIYAWKWMHATEHFFKSKQDIRSLIDLLEDQKRALPENALQLYFTSNHDENSWNGTEYEKYGIYAKALAVFNYTYCNSVPLIYSGQELPNCKRLKFFEKDIIEWKEPIELHSFYKTLSSFHKRNFTADNLKFILCKGRVLAFSRSKNDSTVLVFLNLDEQPVNDIVFLQDLSGKYRDIFSENETMIFDEIELNLEPGGFLVLEKLA